MIVKGGTQSLNDTNINITTHTRLESELSARHRRYSRQVALKVTAKQWHRETQQLRWQIVVSGWRTTHESPLPHPCMPAGHIQL